MLKSFFKKFLSQFHYRFPRSIIYMLQVSEYNIRDYVQWLDRVHHFGRVEVRKTLVPTAKSKLMRIKLWAIIVALFAGSIAGFVFADTFFENLIAVVVFLFTPILSAYVMVIPVFFFALLVQKPHEWHMIRQATKKLAGHKGFKIAIAGSYGKTSMRNMLATVLREAKNVATQEKNFNTLAGISRFITNLKGDEEVIIFELGEYMPGDIAKMCTIIRPDLGIVTGINEAHLHNFKNVNATAHEIFTLADFVHDKPLYVNGENTRARQFVAHMNSKNLHEYSREGIAVAHVAGANFTVSEAETDLDGVRFTITCDDTPIRAESGLLGLHQIGPLSAAIKIAHDMGLTREQIEAGITKTRAFEHRLEPKINSVGVITLDDSYNGNPDGVVAVIDFLASLRNTRRFYVTPGLVEMGSASEAVHRMIGQKLARSGIENVVLIQNSATPDIEFGLLENKYPGKIITFPNAFAAFAALEHLTTTGDVVLLQNDWPDQYA